MSSSCSERLRLFKEGQSERRKVESATPPRAAKKQNIPFSSSPGKPIMEGRSASSE
jgi:hypothetical protein